MKQLRHHLMSMQMNTWNQKIGVANYDSFLIMLHYIIFGWWSYTHHSDQNFYWIWIFKKVLESATRKLNLMEWSGLCPFCWVLIEFILMRLIEHCTQHKVSLHFFFCILWSFVGLKKSCPLTSQWCQKKNNLHNLKDTI